MTQGRHGLPLVREFLEMKATGATVSSCKRSDGRAEIEVSEGFMCRRIEGFGGGCGRGDRVELAASQPFYRATFGLAGPADKQEDGKMFDYDLLPNISERHEALPRGSCEPGAPARGAGERPGGRFRKPIILTGRDV